MPTALEVTEGVQIQGVEEQLSYQVTTTPWGSSPTSPSAKAFLMGTKADVSDVVFPTNSPSVACDVITLSPLRNLMESEVYRIEVTFTIGSNVFSCYFFVHCLSN